jgi:abhydrolase domain-containing protein 5
MVMIHGYGGASVVFYRIIKALSEHFHLYLLDIIGMGGSSRPAFTLKTADEADEYFINFIE